MNGIYSAYYALTASTAFCLLSGGRSSSPQQLFQVANTTDGVQLCSVDTPLATFNAEQLVLQSSTDHSTSSCVPVPLQVLCAWKCSTSGNCSSFNWKTISQLCELYDYSSEGNCAVVRGCVYYQRFDFRGNCSLKGPITTTYLVQRNVNGSNFFQRKLWDEYAKGFGSREDNFWMGNDKFHQLTVAFNCSMTFNMKMYGAWYFFSYPSVTLTSSADGYRLLLDGSMSGNTSYGFSNQNGKKFSTYDRDNDESIYCHCGQVFGVGWWYVDLDSRVTGANCGASNLNANDTYFYFYNNGQVHVESSSMWITCI